MDVLTLKSLEKLDNYLKLGNSVDKIIVDFEALEQELELEYVPISFSLQEPLIELIHPTSSIISTETDKQNLMVLYNSMSELTNAQSTDERLWSTLALKNFNKYTLARWPLPTDKTNWGNHIRTHWLCGPGPRDRVRDNAISRLWWMGHFVSRMSDIPSKDVIDILLNNSDYRLQTLDRNSSVSSLNAATAIIRVTKKAFDNNLEFDRESFRNFMKRVNFIAGRSNFAACLLSN